MAKKPIRVSQLNSYLAKLIAADGVLSDVCVIGEVSNFKVHGSGHVYFSLIDNESRIDCFLGSGIYRGIGFKIGDGTEVVAEGYVNVYEKGGRYSLTVRRLIEGGRGALSKNFDLLKKKLQEKGYFDESKKKALPAFPLKIAVVTSGTGAAVNDIIKIITSRNKVADVLIYPTLVQGEGAADMIALRIEQVNADDLPADVMIVGRGGGSSEDLAAFNEEAVSDAIFNSRVPVVSAVGHETDFTIADFVADRRAETPTAAAVLVCPDTDELSADVENLFSSVKGGMARLASYYELRVRANNLNALVGKLKSGVSERRAFLGSLFSRIRTAALVKAGSAAELESLWSGITGMVRVRVDRSTYRLQGQGDKLEALSPMRVLSRGYAIVTKADGSCVKAVEKLAPGDVIGLRFSDGRAEAAVRKVNKI